MIRINNFIFNENEIFNINSNEKGNVITIVFKDNKRPSLNMFATFEDIEWNYENNNEYCNVFYEDRIKELEEKNKTFEDYNKDLNNQLDKLEERIDKAIKYIRSEYTITDDDLYLTLYSSDGTLDKLEKILKGEE